MSGKSAITGFHSHRSRRAELPHRALLKDNLRLSHSSRGMAPLLPDKGLRQRKHREYVEKTVPRHFRLLSPSAQRFKPDRFYPFEEGFHRAVVTHDAEISVVTAQHLAQPELLLSHWNMYAPFHFHPQRLKFSDQTFRDRFALYRERTVSQRPAIMREA